MSSDHIKKLCDYMDQNKAKNYPIENAMLYESEDFIKNGYLRMLAVVLQVGNNITEGQMNLYKRIVEGASAENTTEEYMRQAMEIKISEYKDFINECVESLIAYRFALDCLVIIGDGEKETSQLKVSACIFEALRLKKREIYYLAIFAKIILEQKVETYIDIAEKMRSDEQVNDLFNIMEDVLEGYEVENIEDEDIENEDDEDWDNEYEDNVEYIGETIDLNNCKLKFKGEKEVYFEHCKFIESGTEEKSTPLSFFNCKEIIFNNCIFKSILSGIIRIEKTDSVLITNCKFVRCRYTEEHKLNNTKKVVGGVIYTTDTDKNGIVTMENTTFIECGCIAKKIGPKKESISNCKVYAEECEFNNCYNYVSLDDTFRKSDTVDTLFSADSKEMNCEYYNSISFN